MTGPTTPAFGLPWLALLLAAGLLGSACADLPARAPVAGQPTAAALAQQLTVRGPRGPVSPVVEARTLAGVRAEGQPALLTRQLAALAALGDADLYRGNSAELLIDGPATLGAMKAAIEAAQHRVLLETYIFEDSGLAADIAALLVRKAAAGVRVALLYDSVGSSATNPAFFAQLAAQGVQVCMFNPIKPWQGPLPWTPNHRDHRKLLVVDNAVAFAGGLNISRVYASGSFGGRRTGSAEAGGWRDTHIALRGPVVAPLGRLFQATWRSQQCPGAAVDAPPAAAAQPGERLVQVLAVDPGDRAHRVYRSMMAAIDASQHSVHLTMAYFAPGADMVQALCDAALRGVAVVLVLPGKTDFQWVLHAGRANYQQLLDAGVRIHELRTSLLHAKTAVIDGVYATVGSSNLDWRSLADNNELNVVVLGDDFGQTMEQQFQIDLAQAEAIDAAQWRQRGLQQRTLEQIGRLMERLL